MAYAICTRYVVPPLVVVHPKEGLGVVPLEQQKMLGLPLAKYETEDEAEEDLVDVLHYHQGGDDAWLADHDKWTIIQVED